MAIKRIQVVVKETGKTWEESSVVADVTLKDLPDKYEEQKSHIDSRVEMIAHVYKKQVRWNYYGHLNGNYIGNQYLYN
ncbi:hypothetical protein U0X36_25830 [Bacillus thuringiensis]|uniref:hypothetical protein n=1 Tax=Bacillus thuringiensis TaxID=1428 RepID=UPI000E47DE81|nr:hypothetical protein [Bacillus thuringiensis]MDZ3956234.1 hypothetical protein [Bacillus thuringiensis]RGP43343.1 hypothetical protein BTW32_29930 [Bacillus thuringiensis]